MGGEEAIHVVDSEVGEEGIGMSGDMEDRGGDLEADGEIRAR